MAAPQPPSWHQTGRLCMQFTASGLSLLGGLLTVRLWPAVGLPGVFGSGALIGLSFLVAAWLLPLQARRLSAGLGGRPWLMLGLVGIVIGLIGLGGLYPPAAAAKGVLGPPPDGVRRVGIGKIRSSLVEPSQALWWAAGTQDALYQKLSQIPELQLINLESPQVLESTRRELDLWIEGQIVPGANPILNLTLTERGGVYLATISRELISATPEAISALHQDLATAILIQLDIPLTPQLTARIQQIPTANPKALLLNNEGVELVGQHRYTEAMSKFDAALLLDANYGDAHTNKGVILSIQGQDAAAIEQHKAAIKQRPEHAVYHYNLGHSYLQLAQYDEVVASLQTAIERDPGMAKAYNELGNAYLALEQWDAAQSILERGLRIDPALPQLSKNLGRAALGQKQPQLALSHLNTALELYTATGDSYGEGETRYLLAQALADANQRQQACKELDWFQEREHGSVNPWYPQASSLAEQSQCQF